MVSRKGNAKSCLSTRGQDLETLHSPQRANSSENRGSGSL